MSRLEECKACQSKGDSCFRPREGLFNIKVEKVVRFFLLFKVNTNKYVSLNKLSIDSLFYGFLDHHNRYDLLIYAMQVLFDVCFFVIVDLRR